MQLLRIPRLRPHHQHLLWPHPKLLRQLLLQNLLLNLLQLPLLSRLHRRANRLHLLLIDPLVDRVLFTLQVCQLSLPTPPSHLELISPLVNPVGSLLVSPVDNLARNQLLVQQILTDLLKNRLVNQHRCQVHNLVHNLPECQVVNQQVNHLNHLDNLPDNLVPNPLGNQRQNHLDSQVANPRDNRRPNQVQHHPDLRLLQLLSRAQFLNIQLVSHRPNLPGYLHLSHLRNPQLYQQSPMLQVDSLLECHQGNQPLNPVV